MSLTRQYNKDSPRTRSGVAVGRLQRLTGSGVAVFRLTKFETHSLVCSWRVQTCKFRSEYFDHAHFTDICHPMANICCDEYACQIWSF